ncbi:DoxX family protein [Flavobacterium sp. 316]|uniref:DoxX family membrane protein n=1 Tax=Flavobacterium sediminilitoris TaxID=2024526 RepID=A0ABY4HNR6_9FLAO|nr:MULTISPECIES: DoxX family membrane protein [Flavobacterium]KIX19751.1 DoxX family protein [Flavobacterium sp. 316]UOX33977.1 DoxX family membrane protein [Flavobacterium sediminilitoris]
MDLPWHQYLMGLLYILAGLNHFRQPKLYIKIIPPYFTNPKLLNQISGLAEIVLGIGICIPLISKYSAIGIILLLLAVFPANLYMFHNEKAALGLPKWLRLARLPLQILLIYWSYYYIN